MRQKPREDTDKMCVRQTFPPRYSRSTMLHERRSDEVLRLGVRARARARARPCTLTTHPESLPLPGQVLQAFRRQQDGNDGLQMRRPGTSAQPSTMQNVTPEVHARPEPC